MVELCIVDVPTVGVDVPGGTLMASKRNAFWA
jgi:hypothetical protein